jgi:thiamine biosynthesis protein ThiS
MRIILNNNEEHFETSELTISELLELKNFTFKMLVVRINGNLIKKENYPNKIIKDKDNVTVLHMISGG